VSAHNGLGNALAQTPGRVDEAIAQYQEAIRISPDYFEAHMNLAGLLSRIPGRGNEAIVEYQEALRIRPEMEEVREILERLKAGGAGSAK
jgi:tetratricopeptide (TPR) repeat protein